MAPPLPSPDPSGPPTYEHDFKGVRALVYDLRSLTDDSDAALVVDATSVLAAWLNRHAVSDAPAPLAVVLVDPDGDDPALAPSIEALHASLRVMVNSIALERPRTHLTTIRTDSDSLRALEDTVGYLARPAGAFVTAACIDLRSTS